MITVTDKAAAKIKEILEKNKISESGGLRFSVMGGGCSGFQYHITTEAAASPDDEVFKGEFERDGQKQTIYVFVGQKSLRFLDGSVIDYGYVEHLLGEGFKITNPNISGSCGCGSSFTV